MTTISPIRPRRLPSFKTPAKESMVSSMFSHTHGVPNRGKSQVKSIKMRYPEPESPARQGKGRRLNSLLSAHKPKSFGVKPTIGTLGIAQHGKDSSKKSTSELSRVALQNGRDSFEKKQNASCLRNLGKRRVSLNWNLHLERKWRNAIE